MQFFFYVFCCLTFTDLVVSQEPEPYLSSIDNSSFIPCDFEKSIQRYGKSQTSYQHYSDPQKNRRYAPHFQKSFDTFKHLFDTFQASIATEHKCRQIPKKIHQIWLGSSLPEKYVPLIQTWANWQGWEYKLWTDTDVSQLSLRNQRLFDRAKNYGEKSDILRLEILSTEGGLYVDVDFECLCQPFFDLVHEKADFYAGIEPLEHGGLKICNAIIASIPEHPLLDKCIEGLSENYKKNKKRTAIEKCGPNYFTEMINNYLQDSPETTDVFFPTSYLYPTSKDEVESGNLFCFPESVAQHYWSGSWIIR